MLTLQASAGNRCPVCGSTNSAGSLQAKGREIITCADCRLRFANDLGRAAAEAALEDIAEPFVQTYIKEESSYRTYFRQKVADLRSATAPGSLLDVGCATGVFLDEAKRSGFTGVGLDLLPAALDYARERLEVDARLGTLEEAAFADGTFDAAALFQIVEHVPGPRGLVREAARVLKAGGVLLLTTPNRNGFLGRVMGRRWFGYYNEEHLTFFEEVSLRRLLEDSGFSIVSLRTEAGREFTLNYVADRLSDYYYTDDSLQSRGGRLLGGLLRLIGGVSIREPGQSLYAIARKI